jgi:hypothetical protein
LVYGPRVDFERGLQTWIVVAVQRRNATGIGNSDAEMQRAKPPEYGFMAFAVSVLHRHRILDSAMQRNSLRRAPAFWRASFMNREAGQPLFA